MVFVVFFDVLDRISCFAQEFCCYFRPFLASLTPGGGGGDKGGAAAAAVAGRPGAGGGGGVRAERQRDHTWRGGNGHVGPLLWKRMAGFGWGEPWKTAGFGRWVVAPRRGDGVGVRPPAAAAAGAGGGARGGDLLGDRGGEAAAVLGHGGRGGPAAQAAAAGGGGVRAAEAGRGALGALRRPGGAAA